MYLEPLTNFSFSHLFSFYNRWALTFEIRLVQYNVLHVPVTYLRTPQRAGLFLYSPIGLLLVLCKPLLYMHGKSS